MSVSGKARTMERLSPDVQALRDIMQHRESVVVSEYNDDESTMFVEPEDEALAMELSSYARYDTDGTDVSMNDIGVVEPSQPAHTNQQSIQGSGTPTSTPSRHKRIRNMPYHRCGSKERAKRDEVIMAIRANWPRTQEFFPTRLAPRSSDPTTTYPLEPRDVSRPLLTAVQGLSSVTRDNHEKAFAAMIKAVKKRAKKEKTEEKLLLVDVEKALKACRAAEVYRLTTAQMQSSIGAPAPESLQAGTPRGTVMERGHSAEASSPMATGASSEHGAGETTGDATAWWQRVHCEDG
ncbi:hypothetical protein B0A55_11434 [Friedmanniomyces simplex]|uniref:Uncharacterized protein n=1 Tax=Friedmanniomyces simplex TaxID=329884 RepID=A0A4U0WRK4_9PEZI|nr:hypothetical protein B0A55_11434 [Friedmanniomyces simplex]